MAEALQAVASLQPSLHAVVAHSFGCVVTALALRRGLACERVVLLAAPSDMEPYFATLERALGMGPRGRRAFRERLGRVLQGAGVPGLDITELVAGVHGSGADRPLRRRPRGPVSASRRLAEAWEGSERVQVEGLGHRRLLRNPAVVSRVVDFVAPLPRCRTPPERPLRLAVGGRGAFSRPRWLSSVRGPHLESSARLVRDRWRMVNRRENACPQAPSTPCPAPRSASTARPRSASRTSTTSVS